MQYEDVLKEYFKIQKRNTWDYSFRKKVGSDWAVSTNSRIARTSAERMGSILLFTIGAKKLCQPCGLQEAIVRIIKANGLKVITESTTAGNRTATYVGFDLGSEACSRATLKKVLDQVKLAVADCSGKVGRLL
jgi:hypothetical protein